MAIVNLYSKRKAALERAANDVYSYDTIPTTLRSQLKQMYQQAYDDYARDRSMYSYIKITTEGFRDIVSVLRREYGMDTLVPRNTDPKSELVAFIGECSTDQFLDCVEVFAACVSEGMFITPENKDDYISEINYRFKEAGLGYEVVDTKIVRIDSRVLHSEVLKPTLAVLSSDILFSGAEQEIFAAFEKFRAKDNKGAVAESLKAFESTMKAILGKRQWQYNSTDTASKLIAACFDNGLVPKYMQTHFGALRTMLESGVPTVRNKTSGHGQGSAVQLLDDHFASYVLYTALANIKLLIDCDNALP